MIPSTYLNVTEKDGEVSVQRMRYNNGFFNASEFRKVTKMGTIGDLEEAHMVQGTTFLLLIYNGGSKIECCDCVTGERFDSLDFPTPIMKYVVYPGERTDFRYAFCNAAGVAVVKVESNGKLVASAPIPLEPKTKILKIAVSSVFVVFAYAAKKGIFLSVTNMSRADKRGTMQLQGPPLSLTIGEPEPLGRGSDGSHTADSAATTEADGTSSSFQLSFNILRAIFKSSSGAPYALVEYKLKIGDSTPTPVLINKIEKYSYRDYFDFYNSFVYEGNGPAAAITNLNLHQRPRAPGLDRQDASILQTHFIATEPRTYPLFDVSPDLLYFVTTTNLKAKTKDVRCVNLYYMGGLERAIHLPKELQGGDSEPTSIAFSTTYVIFIVIKSRNKNIAGLWAFGSMDVPSDRFVLIDKTYQYPINRYMVDRSKRSIVLLMRDRIEYVHSDLSTKFWSFHPRYEDIFSEYAKGTWHFTDSSERHKVKSYSHTGNRINDYQLNLVITVIEDGVDEEDVTVALPLYADEYDPEKAKRMLEHEEGVDISVFDPQQSQKAAELTVSHATGHASSTRYTTHSICIDGNMADTIHEEIRNNELEITQHYEEGNNQEERLDDYNEEELDSVASPEPMYDQPVKRESMTPKPSIASTPTVVRMTPEQVTPATPVGPKPVAEEPKPLPETVQPITATPSTEPPAPEPKAPVVPAPAPKQASPAPTALKEQPPATPQVSQGGSLVPVIAVAVAAILAIYFLKK